MAALGALEPRLVTRARADQIAYLYTQWGATTAAMLLGGLIMAGVLWRVAPHGELALWLAAILVNQSWRYVLVRRFHRAAPPAEARERWGYAWSLGVSISGALWGVAGVAWFTPGDPGHQALLIVALYAVIVGSLYLTAVLETSFYGFVLPALLPLIVRVAMEGDQIHLFIAAVMLVALIFILRFGHLLNRMQTQSLAIRYENIDLIEELQAQTADADRARAAAEAANRSKTEFLAAASHDLRQPLHAMGLFAATLSAKTKERELRGLADNINASVEALEALFSTLLDISKLDAGAVVPTRRAVSLGFLLSRIERDFGPSAAAKGLRLSIVPTRAWVHSDPVLLERIVANLASNAIRYTARGGIVIGARRRGGQIRLEVWDSGIGIAETERERIFEEFYQAGDAERHSSKGMGLGLAITRRLARLLEHPLHVDSQPSRGSRFAVELPRCAPDHAEAATLPAVPAAGYASALAGALVAVVDDEIAVVEGMRALYAAWGADVIAAASGDELFAALGEAGRYPELVVADYRLGRGELGTELIERVRRELGLPIPALLISGDSSAQAEAAMKASGCDVLIKPVLPGELRAASARLLAHRASASLAA
jgi:signal transduction histidine kinase